MSGPGTPAPVAIVGGGLAGLAAARTLARRGVAVRVYEAGDHVGGRVRTDRSPDGFLLDRGFQVLFTEYPAVGDLLDLPALRCRAFDAGALIAGTTPWEVAVDPFAHPLQASRHLARSPFTLGDDWRVLRWKLSLVAGRDSRPDGAAERTAAEELRALGFSERARERFFRPFFAGVTLDRSLGVRAPWFRYLFRMLSAGKAVLPAGGMGAIADQLAAGLPPGSVRLNARVTALEWDAQGRVGGLRVGEGSIPARAVILAADIWRAQALLPTLPDLAPLGCTTIYFAGPGPLCRERKLVLNPDPDGFLNEVAPLSNVAPSYAPPGQHLLSATSLVAAGLDDEAVETRSRAELRRWFGPRADAWRRLAVYHLPRSQFAQPPGWSRRRPSPRPAPGLYLAGEYLHSSSIQGALSSGVRAAQLALAAEGLAAGGA